jgi:hypothetical protein
MATGQPSQTFKTGGHKQTTLELSNHLLDCIINNGIGNTILESLESQIKNPAYSKQLNYIF